MRNLPQLTNRALVFMAGFVLLSAYAYQFVSGQHPCPLCLLQRLGMIGVAIGALMNLKFGVNSFHYGISLLSAVLGGGVALRQVAMNASGEFPIFGIPVFGFNLYTLSFIVFLCAVLTIGAILFLYKSSRMYVKPRPLNLFEKGAFVLILGITIANIFTTILL